MSKFEESNFYKALQDFFINADKKTFLQFLAEFYNRTEGIIDKDNIQDDLIKELRELYLEFNEKGIDENIVREKVNYFLENNVKIKDIITKLTTNTNNIKNINSQLETIESKKATKIEVEIERERINNLINISSGKVDNVELSDARIGANGIVYDNLGNSIRLQLNEKIDGDIPNSKYYWEAGAYNGSGVKIGYANETHTRTISFLPTRLKSIRNNNTKSFDLIVYDNEENFQKIIPVRTGTTQLLEDNKLYNIHIAIPFTEISNIINSIIFESKPNKYDKLILEENNKITAINKELELLKNNDTEKINIDTILCIGDSLTQGDYGSNPAGTINIKSENYPFYLNKYINKFVTTNVINAGKCGYTSTTYWESKVKTIDFTNVKTIVIMLGTNGYLTDTVETDTNILSGQTYENYANTNTGNYCKIIEYCLERTSNLAQIILVTPPKTSQRDKVKMELTVDVIKKIGKKYSLKVLDGYNEFGISPTNFSTMLPIDGLHGGKLAYKKIGTYIGSNIISNLSYEIED